MYCDNHAIIDIANTLVYHERMKLIEVNHPFIIEVVMKGEIITPYIKSKD